MFKRAKIDARDYSSMNLREISHIIRDELLLKGSDTLKKANEALGTLHNINDNYFLDDGFRVVFDVLEQSRGWNTQVGKNVRKELQSRMLVYSRKLKS